MVDKILHVRYMYLVAVIFTLINSLFFMIAGVVNCIEGYRLYFNTWRGQHEGSAAIVLLEGLDAFLVSLVFLVFSLGMWKIFIRYDVSIQKLPPWLDIKSFKELKLLLWETILVSLVVFCISAVASHIDSLTWEILILPAIVLLLSIGLYLMRGKET